MNAPKQRILYVPPTPSTEPLDPGPEVEPVASTPSPEEEVVPEVPAAMDDTAREIAQLAALRTRAPLRRGLRAILRLRR